MYDISLIYKLMCRWVVAGVNGDPLCSRPVQVGAAAGAAPRHLQRGHAVPGRVLPLSAGGRSNPRQRPPEPVGI